MVLLFAIGLAGLLIVVGTEPPKQYDGTFTIPEGKHQAWETGLGAGTGMEYRVEVVSGGPVDVYVVRDTPYPNLVPYEGEAHEGVMEAGGRMDHCHQYFFIMVDNADAVGANSTGDSEVRVTYRELYQAQDYSLLACSSGFIVVPIILLALPFAAPRFWATRTRIDRRQTVNVVLVQGMAPIVLEGDLGPGEVDAAVRRALMPCGEAQEARTGGGWAHDARTALEGGAKAPSDEWVEEAQGQDDPPPTRGDREGRA